MAASVVSLVNRALLSIGARATIASLTEGSTEADAAGILYTPTFEALARSAPWNCLRQQQVLSLLAAAQGTPENPDGTTLPIPPIPWLYSYELPSDSLDVRFILPPLPNASSGTNLTTVNNTAATWLPSDGQVLYTVAYATDSQGNPIQVILTNQTQAICVYTVNQPNPIIWDSLFQAAFVASLAAYFVPALSLNLQLMSMQVKLAEQAITQARVRDGDEGVTCQNRNASWMTARMTGALYADSGDGYAPWLYANYSNMTWPAG